MGFFSRLKAIFSRKKEEKQEELVELKQEQPLQSEPPKETAAAREPASATAPLIGKEKKCQNCGAPNPANAPRCWLCKKDIY